MAFYRRTVFRRSCQTSKADVRLVPPLRPPVGNGGNVPMLLQCQPSQGKARPPASDDPRSSSAIARNVFTTEGLAPSRQFDAYREHCAPVIEISPNEGANCGFDAFCEMWQLGHFGLRRI